MKHATVPTPWMGYYPDRFIKETQQLRPIEIAAYYRMYESYAQSGYLLDDIYMLRSIARLDSELTVLEGLTGIKPDYEIWLQFMDATISSLLARFFFVDSDGTYHHSGWDKDLVKARTSYDARVKGANATNEKRAAERTAEQYTTNNGQQNSPQQTAHTYHRTAKSNSLQPTGNMRQLIARKLGRSWNMPPLQLVRLPLVLYWSPLRILATRKLRSEKRQAPLQDWTEKLTFIPRYANASLQNKRQKLTNIRPAVRNGGQRLKHSPCPPN